jgi:hypothetical protein
MATSAPWTMGATPASSGRKSSPPVPAAAPSDSACAHSGSCNSTSPPATSVNDRGSLARPASVVPAAPARPASVVPASPARPASVAPAWPACSAASGGEARPSPGIRTSARTGPRPTAAARSR